MTNEIKKIEQNSLALVDGVKTSLDNWLKRLSSKPKQALIKKNQFANNAEYLEIGYLQAELDRVYHGLWSWSIIDTKQMINGVQVSGTLEVFHPVAGVWIKRSGIAFKEFQLTKGVSEPTPDNLSKKALERDIPIANAEAFKNACKTIGNAFGRHLNRKFQFEHIPDENIIDNLLPKTKENE